MMRIVYVLFISFIFSFDAASATCQQRHCMGVVDAGSTGSRLHIYAYDMDINKNPVHIEEVVTKKINPGFSTLEPNQETIDAYLNDLFINAPADHLPVYFYSTAGMRLLSPSKQKLYYQALRQWFSRQSQWQLMGSRTITGREEGIWGWLAVNYQLGTLDSADKPLVSVMDMGGASVQVTLPLLHLEDINEQDVVSFELYGRHLVLFSHSLLGLGQTLLSQQFLDEASCFAVGYPLPGGLEGRGDASACQQRVTHLINGVHETHRLLKPVIMNNAVFSWYVLGSVAALAEDKLFAFENNQLTNKNLLQQADSLVCHQPWQDLYSKYPNNDYLPGYCLYVSYYYALMVNGYGIDPEQPIHYLSSGQGSDWSLGVVLHQP